MSVLTARAGTWLEPEAHRKIVAFAEAQQVPGGGFRGRDGGGSDLYYALFGAGVLDALGERRPLRRLRGYVKAFGAGDALDFVHLACLARLRARVIRFGPRTRRLVLRGLEQYRAANGGYNHARKDAAAGTAYGAFLASLAYADSGQPMPGRDAMLASLEELKAPDGAYANQTNAAAGSTNATAAAVLIRNQWGAPTEPRTHDWLLARHHPCGGFMATPRAPVPDLLSTATALCALHAAGAGLDAIRDQCTEFVIAVWHEGGGFCGSLADDTPDCEYTYYALLALGVLTCT